MDEIYVKAKDLDEDILDRLPNQDLYTLDEIIGAFEELAYEYKKLEEKMDDFEEEVRTDYRRIPDSTLYGVPESDYDR